MAAPFDQVHPFIAGVDEVLQQLIAVALLMDGDVDSRGIDALRRHDVLGGFFRCRQDQEAFPLTQASQGFHLPGRPFKALGRRREDGLVDDGKVQDRQVRSQKARSARQDAACSRDGTTRTACPGRSVKALATRALLTEPLRP